MRTALIDVVDACIAAYHDEQVEEDTWDQEFRSFCDHTPWKFSKRGVVVKGSPRGCEERFYAADKVDEYKAGGTTVPRLVTEKGPNGCKGLTGEKVDVDRLSPLTVLSEDEED